MMLLRTPLQSARNIIRMRAATSKHMSFTLFEPLDISLQAHMITPKRPVRRVYSIGHVVLDKSHRVAGTN